MFNLIGSETQVTLNIFMYWRRTGGLFYVNSTKAGN